MLTFARCMRNQLLLLNVLLILIATAWLHLIQWDCPVFHLYKFFSSSTVLEPWMLMFNQWTGFIFTIAALALIFRFRFLSPLLLITSGFLFGFSVISFLEAFPNFNEIMEHGIRFTTPLVLYLILEKKVANLKWIIKGGIAATFTGHGLYAVGIFDTPANFINMTMTILHTDAEGAAHFLMVAGILDFVVSIGIFFPKTAQVSLIYCVFWGLATAIARVWAHLHLPFEEIFIRWVPETLLRLPNAFMPLWLLLTYYPFKQR